jgi:hypothetical protein
MDAMPRTCGNRQGRKIGQEPRGPATCVGAHRLIEHEDGFNRQPALVPGAVLCRHESREVLDVRDHATDALPHLVSSVRDVVQDCFENTVTRRPLYARKRPGQQVERCPHARGAWYAVEKPTDAVGGGVAVRPHQLHCVEVAAGVCPVVTPEDGQRIEVDGVTREA